MRSIRLVLRLPFLDLGLFWERASSVGEACKGGVIFGVGLIPRKVSLVMAPKCICGGDTIWQRFSV